jgi:hypothetical protein
MQIGLVLLLVCMLFSTVLFYTQSEGINERDSRGSQNFNFVAAGHFGCSDRTIRTVKGMVKKNPELVLALGDLSFERKALFVKFVLDSYLMSR